MPKSTNKTNLKFFLKEITHKNRTYYFNFNFKKFLWPRAVLANKKIYKLIILKFGNPEEANTAIKKGIIY